MAWLATLAAACFAGGALYASAVEHPARMACGPPMGLAQFRTSHPRATWLQAFLGVLAFVGGLGAWLGGGSWQWLAAGLTVGGAVPYTLLLEHRTSRRLLDPALPPDVPETRRLLRRWGALHLVPAVLGLAGAGWMVGLLAR